MQHKMPMKVYQVHSNNFVDSIKKKAQNLIGLWNSLYSHQKIKDVKKKMEEEGVVFQENPQSSYEQYRRNFTSNRSEKNEDIELNPREMKLR